MILENIEAQREVLFSIVTSATEVRENIRNIGIEGHEDPSDEGRTNLHMIMSSEFVTEAVIALSNALSCLSDAAFELNHEETL